MSEIARLRSKIAELTHDIVKLDMQASIHIDDIKSILNKYDVDDISQIDVDQAAKTMTMLQDEIIRLRALQDKKRNAERELGK